VDQASLGYTNGGQFIKALGSFWNVLFKDNLLITNYVQGFEELLAQSYFDLLEVVLKKSVQDIPVFHREKWTLLTFKESELNEGTGAFLKYGDGAVYGTQPAGSEYGSGYTFKYGGGLDFCYGALDEEQTFEDRYCEGGEVKIRTEVCKDPIPRCNPTKGCYA